MTKKVEIKKNPSSLRFSPYAWAKLIFMRDKGKTEVGGYGICPADDLLYIEDIVFPEQTADSCFIELDKGANSKHMENMFVEHDYQPNQCCRIWIHTHPGNSATPSFYDDEIFQERFGFQDWSVAFILARGGDYTCRLQVNTDSLKYESKLDVELDWASEFWGSDHDEWEEEYKNVTECIHIPVAKSKTGTATKSSGWIGMDMDPANDWTVEDYQRGYADTPYPSGYGQFPELEGLGTDFYQDDFPPNPEPEEVFEDCYGVEWVYIDKNWGWIELDEVTAGTMDEQDLERIKKAQ